jgi:hypothetical protein
LGNTTNDDWALENTKMMMGHRRTLKWWLGIEEHY